MTNPDPDAQSPSPEPASPDRVFRSPAGLAGGALLLAICLWLGGDALIRGEGRTPWLALAALLCAVPLVIAYTLRPAVYANDQRLRVRNPFRTITLPWSAVASLRSGYSNEVLDHSGDKYQLWAIPVSLRGRKRAARRQARAAAQDAAGHTSTLAHEAAPTRAVGDQAMSELRELAERDGDLLARPAGDGDGGTGGKDGSNKGKAQAHWAYELIAPAVAGAVLLIVLLIIG
ncbi:PH domain-containing protein [Streptomyces tsukubensis]|uniref:Low molecular weight protein antigen 6 PH domain-containing protein n=1 Tax=Streptomyces tsukubensis TaxID=83656 RepID=A0A1V4A3M7_9ACTN|nr:PH domain-containing protein [Streptomyces tsukubensis]OON74359.1 hypothetical protein B1H18_24975 [Streptomyces tsukubensis]QFR95404.1 PH domain-containing protein [Streptomyces tsukubensis]